MRDACAVAAASGFVVCAGVCAAETVVRDQSVENAPWKLSGETVYVSSNRTAQFSAKAAIDFAGETLDIRLGNPWENVWLHGTTLTNSSERPARLKFHSTYGKLHVVTREWRGGSRNVLDASGGRLYLRTTIDPADCWSLRLGGEGAEQVMGGGVTGADAARYRWTGPVEFAGDTVFADDTNEKAGGWGVRLTGPLSGSGNATVTLARAFALQLGSRENTFAGRWNLRGGGDGTYRCRLELLRGATFAGRALRIADSDVVLDSETVCRLPPTRVVSGDVRISGGAEGSVIASVLKQGAGTLTLAGPFAVPGTVRVEEGAVSFACDAHVARAVCLAGTTLDLHGHAVVIDELVGSPTLVNAERLTVGRRRDLSSSSYEKASDLLARLKKVAASPQVLWAWTEEWTTWGSLSSGTWPRYRTRIGKLTGRAPLMCYYDLGTVTGTWQSDSSIDEHARVMAEAIRTHWRACRGIPVFSWHMSHPCTTNGFGAAWYRYKCKEHPHVIADILSDRKYPCGVEMQWSGEKRAPYEGPRAWYFARLDEIVRFFSRLTDDDGNPIPLVLRYEHEMDGGWFWWGKGWCTPNEFVAFSRMEADYLREKLGKDRILFAYTPDRTWKELGKEGDGGHNFLSWYPGDDYVDIMGFDDYSIGKGETDEKAAANFSETLRKLRLVGDYAKSRGKVLGVTETGCKDARTDFWARLLKLATTEGLDCAFVNTWGGPWTLPDSPEGVDDQRRFVSSPAVMTISDDAFQQAADATDTGTIAKAGWAGAETPRSRTMRRLREVAASKSYYWAWTHPWLDVWNSKGDASHAVTGADGKAAPQATAEVRLTSVYQKYADGKRPFLAYSDLAGLVGTWHSPKYYETNRASLTAAIRRYWRELGGVMVFSWHMDQPYCTNGFRQASYRFKSTGEDRNVIRQILDGTGGPCGTDTLEKKDHRPPCANPREWYMRQLKDVATFFKGLVDEETGERIPVILRYGHECDGSWFWWGRSWCTADEFRRFSRMTADYLRRECGDGQILFAYTPDRTWTEFGKEGDADNTFLAYYPGDTYVDILGLDDYSIGHGNDEKAEASFAETLRKLRLMTAFADSRGQVAAISETGGQKKRDDFWQYVHRLMTADGVKLAFVDTWGGCYGTIPDTPESEKDELAFARRPETLMEGSDKGFREVPAARTFNADGLRTRLLEIGRSSSFVYAWSTSGGEWGGDRFDRFRREAGVSPLMYFAEFRDIGGTWYAPETYARHRAAFSETVRRQWAAHRAVPMVTWHIQNPYIPPKWRDVKYGGNAGMRYRYSSPDYPQEHRYVLREIAAGTGSLCGTGRIDGVSARTFANPREWYLWCLRDVAAYCRTLVDETGARIPIVFRPFHEMDGDWFWWGPGSASPEDFIAVFRLTVDVLREELGAENVLFAYGADRCWKPDQLGAPGKGGFLNWYPGDAYADIVGYDDYSIGKGKDDNAAKTTAAAIARLRMVSDFARAHGKSCGLFETGAKDSVDGFYSLLHKVATAEGVNVAIMTTYDGPWTFPETEAGKADMRRMLARPDVLTSAHAGAFGEVGTK